MTHSLPVILGAGLFSSELRFRGIKKTQPRTVKTWELEYFFEDGGTSVVNNIGHSIRRGQLLLAKPGDVRCSHLPFQCRYVHFMPEDPMLVQLLSNVPVYFDAVDPKTVEASFSRIASLFCSASSADQMAAEAELVLLFREICEDARLSGPDESDTVIRAQKFMERHYSEKLSVQDIAEACSVSPSYLHKLFARRNGLTPGEYLLGVRITAAREMLINTALPLSEIAVSCGFGAQSYFSDCFRRKTGLTPGQFRRSGTYLP